MEVRVPCDCWGARKVLKQPSFRLLVPRPRVLKSFQSPVTRGGQAQGRHVPPALVRPQLRLALSLAVLVNLREGAAVPRGAVHAQGHRPARQRVPGALEARGLPTVPPGGLQRQDQREHHHLPPPR